MAIPAGFKVQPIADESWRASSYSFDLAPTGKNPSAGKPVGVEILMHAIGRAQRHGALDGDPFRSRSGLKGIETVESHARNDTCWYFAIPRPKTESCLIVRVIFSDRSETAQRRLAHAIFRSVQFIPASGRKGVAAR